MGNIYGNKGADDVTAANEKYFGDSGDSMHHSRYYHRYFEGYTEVRTENPESKYMPYKIERIYTSPYTVVDMKKGVYPLYLFLYGLLVAVAVLLYVSAFTDYRVSINMSRVSALAIMVTLVPLFVLAVSLLGYYFRPKKMKYYDYRTSTGRLKLWSLIAAGGCFLAVLIFCVYLWVTGSADSEAEILYIVKLIAAAAACLAVFFLERGMRYRQVPNDVKLPEGEYHRIQ